MTEQVDPISEDTGTSAQRRVPERIGKYRVVGVLGQGAMGVVYKAADPVIGRHVAIKTIRAGLLDDDQGTDYRARFRNEARAAGSLNHPGIVSVYDYGEEGELAYLVMELVEGRSLAECLTELPQFPLPDTLRVMTQLLDALQFAHERGVVHRDIKPANVLVTRGGQAKITDFGIARIPSSTLTQVGAAMGSPSFMAPEQFLGEEVDHRADLFSAGVVLYRMLAGVLPFTGTTKAILYRICHEQPTLPSTYLRVPQAAALDAVTMRALAKRADERYANAAQFRIALEQAVRDPASVQPSLAGPGVAQTSDPAAAQGGAWSVATIEFLGKSLSAQVGPVAQIMVRRAARTKGRPEELIQRIADQFTDPQLRQAFLEQSDALAQKVHRLEANPNGPPTLGGPGSEHSPQLLEMASKALTYHVGPIASVLLRKALAAGGDRAQFIERLAGHIASSEERERFLAQMAKIQ